MTTKLGLNGCGDLMACEGLYAVDEVGHFFGLGGCWFLLRVRRVGLSLVWIMLNKLVIYKISDV